MKIDNKTRRKRIAQGVRAMLWGERRERQSAERKRPSREGEGQREGLGLSVVLQTDTQPRDTGSN